MCRRFQHFFCRCCCCCSLSSRLLFKAQTQPRLGYTQHTQTITCSRVQPYMFRLMKSKHFGSRNKLLALCTVLCSMTLWSYFAASGAYWATWRMDRAKFSIRTMSSFGYSITRFTRAVTHTHNQASMLQFRLLRCQIYVRWHVISIALIVIVWLFDLRFLACFIIIIITMTWITSVSLACAVCRRQRRDTSKNWRLHKNCNRFVEANYTLIANWWCWHRSTDKWATQHQHHHHRRSIHPFFVCGFRLFCQFSAVSLNHETRQMQLPPDVQCMNRSCVMCLLMHDSWRSLGK